MASYQFVISPVFKPKPSVSAKEVQQNEEIAILSLAPFTPNVKLCFDNVIVGTSSDQKLWIQNPFPYDLKVSITNMPSPEHGVTFSWENHVISANDKILLYIFWNPIVEEAWRHSFIIDNGRRLKKEVPITFKSVNPKKSKISNPKKNKQGKFTVTSKKVKVSSKRRISGTKSNTFGMKKQTPPKPLLNRRNPTNKENISPAKGSTVHTDQEFFLSPSSATFNIDGKTCEIRRETYTVNNYYQNRGIGLLSDNKLQNISNDSLESTPIFNHKFVENSNFTYNMKKPKELESKNLKPTFESTTFLLAPDLTFNTAKPSYSNNKSLNTNSGTVKRLFTSPIHISKTDNMILDADNQLANISSGTYVKGNLSSETYTKDNLNTETKMNLSSGTYVKDTSLNNFMNPNSPEKVTSSRYLSSLAVNLSNIDGISNISPIARDTTSIRQINMSGEGVRNVIEANLWSSKKRLSYIPEYNENLHDSNLTRSLKRKSNSVFDSCPPKKKYSENKSQFPNTQHPTLNWNKKKNIFNKPTSDRGNISSRQKARDLTHTIVENPFLWSIDPFLTGTLYYNEEWMENQEVSFRKWLNALLTPPMELNSDTKTHPTDVAKLWQECKRKPMLEAPTKEFVSNKYHTDNRLNLLRKSARNLYRSEEVSKVLSKMSSMVADQKLIIRTDRNIHVDLNLQSRIMHLFLCYTPLWLRIGLETIYGIILPLNSNSDTNGLSRFIIQHFFKDAFLLKKHKSVYSPNYATEIKKFILTKFLALVYFLDVAKTRVLIAHDPCLFCKDASIKDSRNLLLEFSKELLSAIDVTRSLRFTGYTVNHIQKYIHEFDYNVLHLGADLRDGVRLAKVMEIILLLQTGTITTKLRVPAISRLQKIHNMELVFNSLTEANFQIVGDITPNDIVDGHHEKTLSFLWQIIYKFQAPRITNASVIVQNWWRSLTIVLKRRILCRKRKILETAAIKIQKWYRRLKFVQQLNIIIPLMKEHLKQKLLDRNATKIQAFFRMYIERKRYIKIRRSVIALQTQIRKFITSQNWKRKVTAATQIQAYFKMHLIRKRYLKTRSVSIRIQQLFRTRKEMKLERRTYVELKNATIFLQQKYRANKEMKIIREKYTRLKWAAIVIQKRFRAKQQMEVAHFKFLKLKQAVFIIEEKYQAKCLMQAQYIYFKKLRNVVINIQRRFRANRAMQIECNKFKMLKWAACVIQRKFRAIKTMQYEYSRFQDLKRITIMLQRKYRAKKIMHVQYDEYQTLKMVVIKLQRRFRANNAMRNDLREFQRLKKSAILIQRRYRAHLVMKEEYNNYIHLKKAAIIIQRRFRATISMRNESARLRSLKNSTIFVQRKFRATKLMKIERVKYLQMKNAAVIIQQHFRARMSMKIEYNKFQNLKNAAVIIQRRFRANRAMKIERNKFKMLKSAACVIQRKFRAIKTMQYEYNRFQDLKRITIMLQRKYRAKKIMRVQYDEYQTLKIMVIKLQRRFRANRLMQIEYQRYQKLKISISVLQMHFRAYQAMQIERTHFLELKNATVNLQRRFRANRASRIEFSAYKNVRCSIIAIQRWFRSCKIARMERQKFVNLRKATIFIQRRFRANQLMKLERNKFQAVRRTTIIIQQRFRANNAMRNDLREFQRLKKSAILIQRRYRAHLAMKEEYDNYIHLKKAAIIIQRRFRATISMRNESARLRSLRNSTIFVQRKFRASKLMKIQRVKYLQMKNAAVIIQQHFRARMSMKIEYNKLQNLKNAAVIIQRRFRANRAMKIERNKFKMLKSAACVIQQKFRAIKTMQYEYNRFQNLKRITIMLQRKYRAKKIMRVQYDEYQTLKIMVIKLQQRFRGNRLMKMEYQKYQALKTSASVLQKHFRAYQAIKIERTNFIKLKIATITIQRRFRANRATKIERCVYKNTRCAIITIQRWFRNYRNARMERERFINLRRVTRFIQQKFRVNQLMKLERQKYLDAKEKRKLAATKIQALWRGYKTRKENPDTTKLRQKVKQTLLSALPQNTLGKRKDRALQTFASNNPSIFQIIRALEDLEFITRRCKDTCVSMSRLVPNIYEIIKSTNRSVPEKQACSVAIDILINIYRHPVTSAAVWLPEHLKDLFTIMIHCCDKDDQLFSHLCTLIWLFAHNEEYKRTIRSISDFTKKIDQLETLVQRRQKMTTRTRYNKTLYFQTYVHLPLPSCVPDWGIDYPDRPKTFSNSIHALASLLDIVNKY